MSLWIDYSEDDPVVRPDQPGDVEVKCYLCGRVFEVGDTGYVSPDLSGDHVMDGIKGPNSVQPGILCRIDEDKSDGWVKVTLGLYIERK